MNYSTKIRVVNQLHRIVSSPRDSEFMLLLTSNSKWQIEEPFEDCEKQWV